MENKNFSFMAFGKAQVSKEATEIKRYTGVGSVFVVGVNPNKSELEKLYDRELDKDPEYVTEKDGVVSARIDFIVKTDTAAKCNNGIELLTKVSMFIRKEYRFNKDKTKVQVIDKYGRTAWVTKEQAKNHEIPVYSNGKPANIDKDYRPAYVGEEDITNFLKLFLGIPNVEKWAKNEETGRREVVGLVDNPEDCECRLENIEDYFKGKFNEIKDAINLMPNNKIKVLFGVRTTDEGKQYQDVYTRKFLSNAVSVYDKLAEDVQSAKDNGAYPNTEFVIADLQEYTVQATNFNNTNNDNGDMPFDGEAPAATDWFNN